MIRKLGAVKAGDFLIPRLDDLVFVLFFVCLAFIFPQKLLSDGDTGYHIRAGEYMIGTLSVPHRDIFSFISPPIPWTAHEWLSEVIMASIHNFFGLKGVVVFFSGLIALIYYLLFKMLRRFKGSILVVLLLILLAAISSSLHWLARPHIFSLLIMVVWYNLLDRYQYQGQNHLYLLPPLMVLWVNLHGGFILGFVLLGIYGFGNLIFLLFGERTRSGAARRRLRAILLATLLCLVGSLCNPSGYHILSFPFSLISDRYLMDHVVEFLSPDFHKMVVLPFRLLLMLLLLLLAVSRRKSNIIELCLLLFFINMAFYSARYIALFAVVASPIMARFADRLLEQHTGKIIGWFRLKDANIAAINNQAQGFFWPLLAVLAVPLLMSHGNLGFDARTTPVAAVEFLKQEKIPGNMFNDDNFGDYIIYAAWPQYSVFIDGRLDMYGTERIKEFYKVKNFEPGWESVMQKYNMNWVFFENNAPFSRYLFQRSDWRLIYTDEVASIFVRNIPLYQQLVSKYSGAKLTKSDLVPNQR